jgi:glycyl-tRNA synthetase beta chain
MRWGSSKTRFARPIRWVLAAFNENLVPFSVEDVPSSLLSHGHRFYAPTAFEAKNLEELTTKLRNAFVEPVMEMRKERILKQTIAVANGAPEISDDLLDENTFLCEWPTAISGTFPESYLELPEPVLVTAMAKHERMFPVRDANGKLTNSFVFIRNSGEDETVARGCEWVLGARFNDARFFYEQDQKHTLDDFLEKTNDMLFQAQLGTVRQRADRLSKVCEEFVSFMALRAKAQERTTLPGSLTESDSESARLAGLYAKADLSTGLVSELSSLQGIIGGEYARSAGFSEIVVRAISEQYQIPTAPITSREDKVAATLIVVDQLDKLAGYLGLGMDPTGSSDPYGLRKAVTILIRIGELWEGDYIGFDRQLFSAVESYREQGVELDYEKAKSSLETIFRGRYEALFPEISHDVFNAVFDKEFNGITDVAWALERLRLVHELKSNDQFVQAASRPINIISAAKKKGEAFATMVEMPYPDFSPDTPEAEALYNAVPVKPDWLPEWDQEVDWKAHLESLVNPINAFFDNNMVMAEDKDVRYLRLSIANLAATIILTIGDFTKLEG